MPRKEPTNQNTHPYPCTDYPPCVKRYRNRHLLARHIVDSHSNRAPIACEVPSCIQSPLKTPETWTRHMQRRHPKWPRSLGKATSKTITAVKKRVTTKNTLKKIDNAAKNTKSKNSNKPKTPVTRPTAKQTQAQDNNEEEENEEKFDCSNDYDEAEEEEGEDDNSDDFDDSGDFDSGYEESDEYNSFDDGYSPGGVGGGQALYIS